MALKAPPLDPKRPAPKALLLALKRPALKAPLLALKALPQEQERRATHPCNSGRQA
jgi:hypothetical protein